MSGICKCIDKNKWAWKSISRPSIFQTTALTVIKFLSFALDMAKKKKKKNMITHIDPLMYDKPISLATTKLCACHAVEGKTKWSNCAWKITLSIYQPSIDSSWNFFTDKVQYTWICNEKFEVSCKLHVFFTLVQFIVCIYESFIWISGYNIFFFAICTHLHVLVAVPKTSNHMVY